MMRCVERAASIWLLWFGHRILNEDSLNRADPLPPTDDLHANDGTITPRP